MTIRKTRTRQSFSLERLESRYMAADGDLLPGSTADVPENAVPNFSLVDYNATSSTYLEAVSPRDYVGSVTGWYFGHAT